MGTDCSCAACSCLRMVSRLGLVEVRLFWRSLSRFEQDGEALLKGFGIGLETCDSSEGLELDASLGSLMRLLSPSSLLEAVSTIRGSEMDDCLTCWEEVTLAAYNRDWFLCSCSSYRVLEEYPYEVDECREYSSSWRGPCLGFWEHLLIFLGIFGRHLETLNA